MTSLFGSLESFTPGPSTSFTRYVERVKIYFRANEVLDADRQRDIFLTVVGSTCYDRLVDLLAPRSPSEVSLDESVDILTTHYDPKPSKRVQRFHFNNRVQKQDESISDYIAELRRLAQYCEYGTQLEDMLCDRLIVDVRNDDLRRKLMTQTDAGFQRALEIAIAHETAARDARVVTVDQGGTSTPSETTSEVHLIHRQPSQAAHRGSRRPLSTTSTSPSAPKAGTSQSCAGCGGAHRRSECRFRNAECRVCWKLGHISTVCRSKPTHRRADGAVAGPTESAGAAHVVSDSDYSMFALSGNGVHGPMGHRDELRSSPPIIVPITLDGRST